MQALSDEHALAVEARVLERAAQQTPQQLRNTLAKVVMQIDPEGAEQRRRERVRGRRVELQPTEPGMGAMTIHHTAEHLATAYAVIADRARALKALGGETRTLRQLEADVALELLFGIDGGNRVVEVHLTMAASTAAGADDQPGEVDGIPIPAQAARDLAKDATRWRWVRTNPDTGQVVDVTYPRYTPPESLKTFVKVRDRTCTHPGCTRPAYRTDVDHQVPWPHGPTRADNLYCRCRFHHRAKDQGNWRVRMPQPGHFEWTSPLGFTHVVKPEPVTMPQPPPAPDPPPF